MSGGIKRNRTSLPKGSERGERSTEQQPGDERYGDWDREQLEKMNLRFSSAMERESEPSPGKPRR
jgi:hypothetical protein